MNQLVLLLPPPARKSEISDSKSIEFALPSDYLSFLDIYGSGFIVEDEGLVTSILDLRLELDFKDAKHRMSVLQEMLVDNPDEYGVLKDDLKFFPDAGGYLCFASDNQFLTYVWRTTHFPKDWKVSVVIRGHGIHHTSLNFFEFIYGSLTRSYRGGEFLHSNAHPHQNRRLAFCPRDDPDYAFSSRLAWGSPC